MKDVVSDVLGPRLQLCGFSDRLSGPTNYFASLKLST